MTAIRSARRSASSMKWVTRTTVTPRSRTSSISCHVSRRACGSRPVVSSSRIAIRGLPTRASAIESRWLLAARELAELRVGACRRARGRRCSSPCRLASDRTPRRGRAPPGRVISSGSSLSWSWTPRISRSSSRSRRGSRPRTLDRARVGRPEPADRLDGGGLAGAVRPEDGEDLARPRPRTTRRRRPSGRRSAW